MKTGKEKKALIAGMIGCFLYVIGDFLFAATGKNQSTESIGLMARVAYLTGTVCWGYVHAMFMNVALIFKFTFEKYGDMQAAAEIANKVFYCNAAPMLAAYLLCDVLLSAVMLALIWKGLLPLKNTAQRILASLCNPIAFAEGNRLGVPVILETDAKSKCDRYMHLGMELAGVRDLGEFGRLYDLIKYPDTEEH